jgi:hypothetical protein
LANSARGIEIRSDSLPNLDAASDSLFIGCSPMNRSSNRCIALKRMALLAFLAVSAFAAGGCTSGEKTAVVSGTVKYKDKVVTGGMITFLSEDKTKQEIAQIKADGTYNATSVPWGNVTVGVQPAGKSGAALITGSTKDTRKPPKDSPLAADFDKKTDAQYVDIPEPLRSPATSGITLNVDASPKKFDISLPLTK